jgi:hypothetical protein
MAILRDREGVCMASGMDAVGTSLQQALVLSRWYVSCWQRHSTRADTSMPSQCTSQYLLKAMLPPLFTRSFPFKSSQAYGYLLNIFTWLLDRHAAMEAEWSE